MAKVINGKVDSYNTSYQLLIAKGDKAYAPIVVDEVTLTRERQGSPSKLEFKVYNDGKLVYDMGSQVSFKWNNEKVFFGYLFEINTGEDGIVNMVAYDQLRYFKNKDTIVYKNKKASQVVKMCADLMGCRTGNIIDTTSIIPQRIEDNKTMFDVVQNALDATLMQTGNMFVMYDNFGKIELEHTQNLKLPLLIDTDTSGKFSYSRSIDKETYNKIKLVRENEETGKLDTYIVQSTENMNKWGMLQYYEKIQDGVNPQQKAQNLMKFYNQEIRTLQITECLGDIRVRGGSGVVVKMQTEDIKLSHFMLVESVTHKFTDGSHTMDLTLQGGKINGK